MVRFGPKATRLVARSLPLQAGGILIALSFMRQVGEIGMNRITATFRAGVFGALLGFAMIGGATGAAGQSMETIDPNTAIDGDLVAPSGTAITGAASDDMASSPAESSPADITQPTMQDPMATGSVDASNAASEAARNPGATGDDTTYKRDDLIGAAEGVFGKGAEGLARMIETWLEKQGEPNGYIVGREGGGAIVFGLRYGSGTLYHKVEGQKPVYWTGPSVGFDLGANAANTFVLVYNLYDSEEIYQRFPAAEGQAYVVGGLTASYLRRGDVVLIPIRMGAGLRLGVNAGYMKISKKQKWMPF